MTSFNLDSILGGPSADAATLGGWGVNIHTHFMETYWHILSVHSNFIHFNTRSGVCYIIFCTSLFHLLFISWRPGRFRRNPASSKSLQIIAAGEVWRKTSHTDGGNVNWLSHGGERLRRSLKKLQVELPCDPAVPLLGIYLEKMKTLI